MQDGIIYLFIPHKREKSHESTEGEIRPLRFPSEIQLQEISMLLQTPGSYITTIH